MDKENNIAFLFGARVSIPSGMPSTDQITSKVFSGQYAYLGSKFVEVDNLAKYSWSFGNEYVIRVRELFVILLNELNKHYSYLGRDINYEDLYYLVDSLYEDENMNYENPIVGFFGDHLMKDNPKLFAPIDELLSGLSLIDLCSKAREFISDVVVNLLSTIPSSVDQFRFLSKLVDENIYKNKIIFTLNHDLVLEKYFNENNLKYSDGFKRIDDEKRVWDENYFNETIQLIKLHGSINWHYESGENWYEDKFCIYDAPQRDNCQPLVQIGSFNKIHQYNRGIYFQLQCLFSNLLSTTDRLIISGYSFGDQGINNRIIDWIYSDQKNRIIIIHPNPEKLKEQSRPAITSKWDEWLKSKTMKIIPEFIQNVSLAQIKVEL